MVKYSCLGYGPGGDGGYEPHIIRAFNISRPVQAGPNRTTVHRQAIAKYVYVTLCIAAITRAATREWVIFA
ncbi:hypothetical protein ACLB2K_074929 [Fragaria x ananassa]